jgi:hypothetical protein
LIKGMRECRTWLFDRVTLVWLRNQEAMELSALNMVLDSQDLMV